MNNRRSPVTGQFCRPITRLHYNDALLRRRRKTCVRIQGSGRIHMYIELQICVGYSINDPRLNNLILLMSEGPVNHVTMCITSYILITFSLCVLALRLLLLRVNVCMCGSLPGSASRNSFYLMYGMPVVWSSGIYMHMRMYTYMYKYMSKILRCTESACQHCYNAPKYIQ